MNLKQRYGNRVWDCASTEDFVCNFVTLDDSRVLAEIIARMLDAMPLTDQQKLDIIDPHGVWEIVEEAK
jgi:hypothetical protein